MIGNNPRAIIGAIPINKSLINNINNVFELISAALSNSSCILLSTISDSFPAPLLATSIAAPTATLDNKPAGVSFLAFIALLLINILVFNALLPVCLAIVALSPTGLESSLFYVYATKNELIILYLLLSLVS